MLFGRYNRVAQEFAVEQMRVREELQQAGADVPSLQARMDEAYKVYTGRTMELVKANPDAYTTAFVVYLGLANETEESLRGKYDLLGENAKASVPGRQIAAALERYAALEVGKDAPNFTATRPNGDKFTLRELPGKMKLLVFWASADAASRQANPGFIKLYRQFRPKGFEIVSISLDENRFEWERAIEQDGLIWTNGCDFCGRNAGIASLYMVGNASLPYTILIDDENKIVVKGLAGKDLEESIRQLSKKKTNR